MEYLLSTWNALFVPYDNPEEWSMTTTPKYEPNKDWIRRGRRKHIRQVDARSADSHNTANAAENDRVIAETSGSQGSQRSTARSRTFCESVTMMFREAMREVLAEKERWLGCKGLQVLPSVELAHLKLEGGAHLMEDHLVQHTSKEKHCN